MLSWKLDGLTIVLTYRDGKLFQAATRGNGEVGEIITNNARVFKNIPLSIPFAGDLILRGEAVIKFSKPCLLSHSICSILVKSSTPASPSCALTRVKAKKWTLRFAVISLFSWRTEPEQRLRGFLYRASTSSIPALIFSKSGGMPCHIGNGKGCSCYICRQSGVE